LLPLLVGLDCLKLSIFCVRLIGDGLVYNSCVLRQLPSTFIGCHIEVVVCIVSRI
jgi:hypothetical protein